MSMGGYDELEGDLVRCQEENASLTRRIEELKAEIERFADALGVERAQLKVTTTLVDELWLLLGNTGATLGSYDRDVDKAVALIRAARDKEG